MDLKSLQLLATCHEHLQVLFKTVDSIIPITVIEGYRSDERQAELFADGKSKIRSGGKHNSLPSMAVDVIFKNNNNYIWKLGKDLNDAANRKDSEEGKKILENIKRWYYFIGIVKGTALALDMHIRSGADWDEDNTFDDQKFDDLVHFELVED
jgi:hypothetical protein